MLHDRVEAKINRKKCRKTPFLSKLQKSAKATPHKTMAEKIMLLKARARERCQT